MKDLACLHDPMRQAPLPEPVPQGTDKKMLTDEERRKRKALIDGLRNLPSINDPQKLPLRKG